jgi:hypothetical protein
MREFGAYHANISFGISLYVITDKTGSGSASYIHYFYSRVKMPWNNEMRQVFDIIMYMTVDGKR